jgi:SsrA-binding protein
VAEFEKIRLMTTFAQNKKAFHDYEILEQFEAGIKLAGYEVKSIRRSAVQMKGGYVAILTDGPYVMGVHITPYKYAHEHHIDPVIKRKLLLNAKEIAKLAKAEQTAGLTIVPLELYSKRGLIKLKIAIGRGKKLHDKRNSIKERDNQRIIGRLMRTKG